MIELPKIADPEGHRGHLTFIEGGEHIDFQIARVYYTYDVPAGETRGAHAHRSNDALIIAASGSFDVQLDTGRARTTHFLNSPYRGLFVPALTWRTLANFSSGSVCLVLASQLYDAEEYIRDYDLFLETADRSFRDDVCDQDVGSPAPR